MSNSAGLPVQNEDGIGHLAYFDKERQLSFTYDARNGPMISVSSGGYGEPEFALAPMRQPLYDTEAIGKMLEQFEKACLVFIGTFEQYNGNEPRATK